MFAMPYRTVCGDGVAIHEPGWFKDSLNTAIILIPGVQASVGHIGEQKAPVRGLPYRPLGMNCALMQDQHGSL